MKTKNFYWKCKDCGHEAHSKEETEHDCEIVEKDKHGG
jgi:tRNA(Ile2) C34 agmatinyltransferase TiaS